jgi:protein gp37
LSVGIQTKRWRIRRSVSGLVIDWVMAGGERGPWRAPDPTRPVGVLRDQCTRTGTPFCWKAARRRRTPKRRRMPHRQIDGALHEGFPARA